MGGGVFEISAHKEFVGKIFSDEKQLHTNPGPKQCRRVYEGSGLVEEHNQWGARLQAAKAPPVGIPETVCPSTKARSLRQA